MLFGAFYLCILPTSTHLQSHRHSSSPKAQRDPKGFHLEDRLDHTLHIPPILELVKAALRLLWCGCSLVARHCESLCSVLPCLWLYHYITICLYVYISGSLGLSPSLSLSRPLRCHVASCGHVSYDLFFWGPCADRNGKSWDVMYKYLIKRNSPHDSRLLSSSAQYSANIPQIRAVKWFLFSWHLNMILNFSHAAIKTNAKHASPQWHHNGQWPVKWKPVEKRQAKARANFPWAAPAAGEDPLQRIRFWSLYEYFVCFLNVFR